MSRTPHITALPAPGRALDCEADVRRGPGTLDSATARLQVEIAAFGAFIRSPQMMAQLGEYVQAALLANESPYVTPKNCQAYCGRSAQDLIRLAREGVIHQYAAGKSPRWKKTEINAAIENGTWSKA